MSKDCRTTKNRNNSLTVGVLAGIILCQALVFMEGFMQRKAGNRRREPIRYVVGTRLFRQGEHGKGTDCR